MTKTGRRKSVRSIRGKLNSPGRPPVWQRENFMQRQGERDGNAVFPRQPVWIIGEAGTPFGFGLSRLLSVRLWLTSPFS
jgi:hypothetical protein